MKFLNPTLRVLPCLFALTLSLPALCAPVRLVDQAPAKITNPVPGVILVDFERVAFANLRLTPPAGSKQEVTIHFGEASTDGRINRKPPGTVRYASTKITLDGGQPVIAAPPADKRNTTHGSAIRTPKEWGVVLPFRWVEIEGWQGELKPSQITRQAAFASTWNDDAANFKSSDPLLDRIWELCRYSIKATTFAGVYVDGDRERIPYEADAYINQLCHYYSDPDPQMARDTFDQLMKFPTWPTEWASHMIFMAHADWMRTGDTKWLASRYEALKPKLLLDRAREDGLLVSNAAQVKRDDIVDWPAAERDGFQFKPVNTVVNAFHIRTLAMMADLAQALKKDDEAADYRTKESKARASFQEKLFDSTRGIFIDGEGSTHSSQHANLFPLAFGLLPEKHQSSVTRQVVSRGMACSVYAAQYLMEALFQNDAGTEALALILAPTDRSWKHMVESGTTISWEAWDQKYKPNQDWNHAWGAAPANILPRFILGAEAAAPGWGTAHIRPQPCGLKSAEGKIPTPIGPVMVSWKNGNRFQFSVKLPGGMRAQIDLPAHEKSTGVFHNGKPIAAKRSGSRWLLEKTISGAIDLEVR